MNYSFRDFFISENLGLRGTEKERERERERTRVMTWAGTTGVKAGAGRVR